jgi:hypothetical protein
MTEAEWLACRDPDVLLLNIFDIIRTAGTPHHMCLLLVSLAFAPR